jgi:predicted secreted protein with PEFG-CTERM motif
LTLVAILSIAPSAFAATAQVTMTKGAGSSQNAACVAAKNCFDPSNAQVAPGDTVTWTNTDTTPHTVTSGKASDNQTGTLFDSGLIKAGATFSNTFKDAGTINYFCMVHPWMIGQVIVAAAAEPSPPPAAMTMINGMSTDGSTKVTIGTTPAAPVSGQPLSIALTFEDANGNDIKHQNYAITATQDGKSVISNSTGHTHTGYDWQTTGNLGSANPVDIKITLNGVGLPGSDPSTWIGPKGDVVRFHVIPEFGSVATIVLAIAVISIIAFTAKTRVIPKL